MTVALKHDDVSFWGFGDAGNFAVQVFFALSGWLIGGILLRTAAGDLPRFYFNRVARIWLPYFVSIAMLFGVSLLKDAPDAEWREVLFYDLTFTHNLFITPRLGEIELPLGGSNNHYWSIGVEEQFYLFAPFALVFLKKYRALAVAALTVASFIWAPLFSAICLGVLAAIGHNAMPDWRREDVFKVLAYSGAFVFTITAIGEQDFYRFSAPFAAVFIVAALSKEGPRDKVGRFLGGASYQLYLNHWLAIFISHEIQQMFGVAEWLSIVNTAILSVIIAGVGYAVIERPIRIRRKALYTTGRGMAATIAAYVTLAIGLIGGLLVY